MTIQYKNQVEHHVVNGCNVFIMQDTSPECPLDMYEYTCTIVCWHRRYSLGHKQREQFATPDDFITWWNENHADTGTLKPLYLYDHSGQAISTTPFACPWDSGKVGYAFITAERAKEHGVPDPAQTIEDEVKTYGQWLSGDVYGFTIEDEEGNVIDCSWGYFGLDCVKEEAFAVANGVRNHVRYKHDKHGSPVSAVLSVRIDRSDFKNIASGEFTDGDFAAVIEQLSRKMLDATINRESQVEALKAI